MDSENTKEVTVIYRGRYIVERYIEQPWGCNDNTKYETELETGQDR
jgi:hypothetical protein